MSDWAGKALSSPGKMRLHLRENFTVGELIRFVKTEHPARIEMSKKQLANYRNVVEQDVARPLKFMRIPIDVV